MLRCTQQNRITRKIMPYNHLPKAERNAEIIRRFEGGEGTAALAERFRISARRIRRIIQRYG